MFAFILSGKPRIGTNLSYGRCYLFSVLKVFHTDFHSGLLYAPTVNVQRLSLLYICVIGSWQQCRAPHSLTLLICMGRQKGVPS